MSALHRRPGPFAHSARRRAQHTDYRAAFEWAPVAMMVSRQPHHRRLQCAGPAGLWRLPRAAGGGLFRDPSTRSADEFLRTGERILQQLDHQGLYADDRVMRRVDRPAAGELFWCHVSGRALDPGPSRHGHLDL